MTLDFNLFNYASQDETTQDLNTRILNQIHSSYSNLISYPEPIKNSAVADDTDVVVSKPDFTKEDALRGYLRAMPVSTQKRVSKYNSLIREKAEKYGLDPALLFAVVAKESGGVPTAKSHVGAMGLAQLMPATAKMLGVKNPYDPEDNLEGAAKHLSALQRKYRGRHNQLDLTLAAYNAGAGNVYKAGYKVPNFNETKNYVATIRKWYGV